ncbi:hypothetical protein WR25_14594 isoform E [Diploscapter pachys]|uniref:BTB domain-containing protein n=1 Tax=Diploscapter pachys TaxID=2018661 RepID=A0A2A2LW47_9BILA|nr:hypothetical protein WR25_14594 isoform E [Diploscapter pachys]
MHKTVMSLDEPLHVVSPSSSTSDEHICFQYQWHMRICTRLLENSEAVILVVSRPFATLYNGVQFSWTLRLADEFVATAAADPIPSVRRIFLYLYYKEGPSRDIVVESVDASVVESNTGDLLFSGLHLSGKEFTLGSGWPISLDKSKQDEFTQFIYKNINKNLDFIVDIKLNTKMFDPLTYFCDVDSSSPSHASLVKEVCRAYIKETEANGGEDIEDLKYIEDTKENEHDIHRLKFFHGVKQVTDRCRGLAHKVGSYDDFRKIVESAFAQVYLSDVMLQGLENVEDISGLVEGITFSHIPSLRKELEKLLCAEVMSENANNEFTRRMLILADSYSMEMLKMVAKGVLVDQIIANSNPPKEFVKITQSLEQLATELDKEGDGYSSNVSVDVIVEELQEMTKRVRRVSLSTTQSSLQSSHSR